jgi:hypothetical protein
MEVFKIRHACFSVQTTDLFTIFMSQAKSGHLLRADFARDENLVSTRIPKSFLVKEYSQ